MDDRVNTFLCSILWLIPIDRSNWHIVQYQWKLIPDAYIRYLYYDVHQLFVTGAYDGYDTELSFWALIDNEAAHLDFTFYS